MAELYRRIEGGILPAEGRGVLHFQPSGHVEEAVEFWCPCGERRVYVTSPPHTIEFAEDGTLASLGGSCGYRERKGRPDNWCHFTIADGRVETMHGDSKCPGGDGSIP